LVSAGVAWDISINVALGKLTVSADPAVWVSGTRAFSRVSILRHFRGACPRRGIIGISDHGGWAVLVTVARDGTLLDRRRVELVDETLPTLLPHHHGGQLLPMDGAVALVERVRVSAERHAVFALEARPA
jgi:hypothetical protein